MGELWTIQEGTVSLTEGISLRFDQFFDLKVIGSFAARLGTYYRLKVTQRPASCVPLAIHLRYIFQNLLSPFWKMFF